MTLFLSQVLNGLLDGVYYLLIALGLSLIFSLGVLSAVGAGAGSLSILIGAASRAQRGGRLFDSVGMGHLGAVIHGDAGGR